MPLQSQDQAERDARLNVLIEKDRKLSLLERAATGRPLTSRFGPIHVRSYVRNVNDQSQKVDSHTRNRPGEGRPIDVPLAKNYEKYIGTLIGSGECVDFVKEAVPSLNRQTRTWIPVEPVTKDNIHLLQPGTPLAIIKDGHYPAGNNEKHAVIFIKKNGDGADVGFRALEQWADRPARSSSPGGPVRPARNEQPVREGEFSLTGKKAGIYDGRKYWVIK